MQKKETAKNIFYSAAIKQLEFKNDFSSHVNTIVNKMDISELSEGTWVVSSRSDQNLLSRLNSNCVSLTDYIGGEAYYGIKTGLTEAFLVNDEDRKDLIEKDPKSTDLLKPVLRGRNIQRWHAERDNLWMIGTFPALNLNIENYPAIKDHLLSYGRERLAQTGENGSRKKTGNDWFETQDIIGYWKEFERPKIMYQRFQVNPCFIYDEEGLYCNDSIWVISKNDKMLLGILNSKMGWWLISKYCTAIQNGYQLIWKYFSQIPIPKVTEKQAKPIVDLVDQILKTKKVDANSDAGNLEMKIDKLVYQLYELTEDEIEIVEAIK